jgi:hypothetical protein
MQGRLVKALCFDRATRAPPRWAWQPTALDRQANVNPDPFRISFFLQDFLSKHGLMKPSTWQIY